jgi:type II secretory pathway component GspD/PulD (secretin)
MNSINKIISKAVIFSLVVICLLCSFAFAQKTEYIYSAETDIAKDPFAQLIMDESPTEANVFPENIPTEGPKPELCIESIVLKFLDAKSLVQVVEKMSSEYGSVSINEKNNSLVICDSREILDRMLSEIRKSDKTPRQIMIEVVILDVQLDNDNEMGINWDLLSSDRYNVEYRQNFTSSRIGTTVEDAVTIGNGSAFNTTGLGGSFSVISSSVRHIVNLIQQKRDVKILASPRVMMVSGATASIEAVEELPYTEISDTAQGGAGALTTTKFKNVGIQLKVSATLTDSNNIYLSVGAEQNVTSGQSDTEIPIVDTRKASTSLLLKDSQTVVFGGLRRQEKTKEVNQIPILGDIPIIGLLFKNTHIVAKNSELIVFLSPRIYKDEPINENEINVYKEITENSLLSKNNEQPAKRP